MPPKCRAARKHVQYEVEASDGDGAGGSEDDEGASDYSGDASG